MGSLIRPLRIVMVWISSNSVYLRYRMGDGVSRLIRSRETLIRITGRSTYTDKAGRKWQPNDFVLSALLDTHDWKNEPMMLISSGQLIEQLGLDKTQRRFSFAQLTGSAELQRIASEARALKRAERPLDRVQQEALSVSDRLVVLGNVMNGNALLIVPSPQRETDAWMVPDPGAIAAYYNEAQFAPAFAELTKMMRAYTQADTFNFSSAARQLQDNLRELSSIYPQKNNCASSISTITSRRFIERSGFTASPLWSLIAHLRGRGRALRVIGVALAVLGLAFHASGIVMRCMIGGRPPVTNMYESIIWVSFAVSFFGMIFFLRYRTTIYLSGGAPGDFDRAAARSSNADCHACEHRSARAGVARQFLANDSRPDDHAELCRLRARDGFRPHSSVALRA